MTVWRNPRHAYYVNEIQVFVQLLREGRATAETDAYWAGVVFDLDTRDLPCTVFGVPAAALRGWPASVATLTRLGVVRPGGRP